MLPEDQCGTTIGSTTLQLSYQAMRGSSQNQGARGCPRCATALSAERSYGASGVTYLWRCNCGWAGVRTVAASSGRAKARSGALAKVESELGPDGRASGDDDGP